MAFFFILGVDKNIIKIHNNEDIKFFYKDFIDIALDHCRSDNQFKGYHLIFKVTVSNLESSFLLIFFANSHLLIDTGKVELSKLPSLT